ncbi:MAG TPA: sugar ABC transporter permease [Aggregatilinea sp.]|jgi:multiple sugar transport system permease protein|uniref:carbohydrate ABC transporter permease n=1 Tax=Aggregatilinea sp. TaxID=2806333 RepID=UPI002BAB10D9|nr:sugar ABC transporter permease [Aggregatilinea sp.]HML22347.1 sugar ABC transporter permease [Aggregatilinea sp.]
MSQVEYAVNDEVKPGADSRRWTLSPRRAQVLWGYLFLAPWIIGFLVFVFGPMIVSLYLSMTDYNIEKPDEMHFIGLDHYQRMFSVDIVREDDSGAVQLQSGYQDVFSIADFHLVAKDQRFWKSIQVTLTFALVSLPINLILALTFAVLTNTKVPGVTLFRTLFYLPSVIPTVVAAFVFQQFLRTQDGWLNMYVLHPLGLGNPGWLQDPTWAIPALTLVGTWGVGTAMLMFLAGLQNVPTELYEAARVDGAGFWSRLRHITIPMISPVILYNLVIGLIGTFQYFVIAYTITIPAGRGGNELSMYVYNLHVYREAYVFFDMGYASALAWFLLVIVLVVTALVFRSSSKWVYYAAGGRA